jgi:hypothetical protein
VTPSGVSSNTFVTTHLVETKPEQLKYGRGDLTAPSGLLLRAEVLSSTSGTVPCCACGHSQLRSQSMSDRVNERRRGAQLARHYRDQENLTIAEIARRLGRAEATVEAYLYDPS